MERENCLQWVLLYNTTGADLKIIRRIAPARPVSVDCQGTQAVMESVCEGLPENVRLRRFEFDIPAVGRQEPTVFHEFVNGLHDLFHIFNVGPIERLELVISERNLEAEKPVLCGTCWGRRSS